MQDGDLVAIIRTGAGIGSLQQFTSDKQMLYAANSLPVSIALFFKMKVGASKITGDLREIGRFAVLYMMSAASPTDQMSVSAE